MCFRMVVLFSERDSARTGSWGGWRVVVAGSRPKVPNDFSAVSAQNQGHFLCSHETSHLFFGRFWRWTRYVKPYVCLVGETNLDGRKKMELTPNKLQ